MRIFWQDNLSAHTYCYQHGPVWINRWKNELRKAIKKIVGENPSQFETYIKTDSVYTRLLHFPWSTKFWHI